MFFGENVRNLVLNSSLAMYSVIDYNRARCFDKECNGKLEDLQVFHDFNSDKYLARTVCAGCRRIVVQPSSYEQYISYRRKLGARAIGDR